MAIAPMPKQRSQLQRGRFPRNAYSHQDPDEPIGECSIHRTIVGENPGAVPSEALQYDLVYIAFCNDKDFWEHWQVVNCARCGQDESISQKNAYIRVVMNLDKEVKLYPTAYTPGFSTIPRNVSERDAKRKNQGADNKQIPGLPEGYSVALDVYILEDAKILLDHQRAFRGRVDPKYRWLDEIVNKGRIPEETMGDELVMMEVSPMDATVVRQNMGYTGHQELAVPDSLEDQKDRHWTWHSGHLPNSSDLHRVLQPAAADTLPLSCFHACPRGLQKDSRREFTHVIEKRPDGHRLELAKILKSLGEFAENHELNPGDWSMQGYLESGTPFGEFPHPLPAESLKFVWSSKQAGDDLNCDKALRQAKIVGDKKVQELKERYGRSFSSEAHDAEAWISTPCREIPSYEEGKRILNDLKETSRGYNARESEEKYNACLIVFSDNLRWKAEYGRKVGWEEYRSTGFEKIVRAFETENELNHQRKHFLWCFDAKGRPMERSFASAAKETAAWPFTLVWKSEDHMLRVHQERVQQERRRQIHEENALINAFGSHVGLPKRDMGSWGQVEDGSAAARRRELDEETRRLDQALADLQAKTSNQASVATI